jgi:hypothetical protein
VHDVANLYVAGSALFTTGGCADPTLTALALGVRLADHLKATLAGPLPPDARSAAVAAPVAGPTAPMPPPSQRPPATKRVAVTVPLASHPELLPDEEISLAHLRHFLGGYDRFVIAPQSMDVPHDDFEVVRFPDEYFGSANAQTRLMMTPGYYEAFSDYEYILTYQLDAIVFSDQLIEWCESGYAFVSAPNYGLAEHYAWPCSGGFALRNVRSFLGVFESERYATDPTSTGARRGWPVARRPAAPPAAQVPQAAPPVQQRAARHRPLSDREGPVARGRVLRAQGAHYNPDFRLPSIETALRFAFDENPRHAFELAGERLPFGAHAWFKQDREFWEPHLLR